MTLKARAPRLARFACIGCGAVSLVRGAGKYFRCGDCIGSPEWLEGKGTGRDWCAGVVAHAMRDGTLASPKGLQCSDCLRDAVEYDHRDYNKPLAVQPVCRSCNLLRGPAIPLVGSVEALLAAGRAPYRRRLDTERLFRTLGRSTAVLEGFPRKLTVDHWRLFWPLPADGRLSVVPAAHG